MLIFKIALRNLLRHTRRTFLLSAMIIAGVSLLFTVSAIFERSARGLEASFSGSLSGNLMLAAETENITSIFGNEMPLVTDYEIIPPLPGYTELSQNLAKNLAVDAWTPVVTATVRLEMDNFRATVPVFGVNPETYFKVCSDISIIEGDLSLLEAGNRGIFLNTVIAEKIAAKNGKKLKIGDPLQMSIYSNGAFRIRKGIFAGIHHYVNEVQPFDKIILSDPLLVRELLNYSAGYAALDEVQPADEPEESFSLDDLFSDTMGDIKSNAVEQLQLEDIEALLALERVNVTTDNAAWTFILIKAINPDILEKQLYHEIRENNSAVKILGWKAAAGFSAQMAFALQAAFTVGIVFIIIGAVLVIMNGLVISVLERKGEIGTMRAVGAAKSFISCLFITETLLLVVCSTLIGILAGMGICLVIMQNGIVLHNNLLITLFGGKVLLPEISVKLVLLHIVSALAVSALAWIYPVCIALRIQPITAMTQE